MFEIILFLYNNILLLLIEGTKLKKKYNNLLCEILRQGSW